MMLCSVKSAAFPYFRRAASHRDPPLPPLPISLEIHFHLDFLTNFHHQYTLVKHGLPNSFRVDFFVFRRNRNLLLGAVASVVGGCGNAMLYVAFAIVPRTKELTPTLDKTNLCHLTLDFIQC